MEWVAATWSSDAENVTISGEGTEVVVTITGDAGTSASVVLDNEYEKLPDLAATGIPASPSG